MKKSRRVIKDNDLKQVAIVAVLLIIVILFGFVCLLLLARESRSIRQSPPERIRKETTLNHLLAPAKPIIYLYPEQDAFVTVKLGKVDMLSHTYPQYPMGGWQVIAQPNGNLIDPKTGKNYYSLYWEGLPITADNLKEGFVVKSEEVVEFLEEKLSLLGLNEREANEFIIYWLPKLEANQYNLIRFQTREEIDQIMPLDIVPAPDTLIRVMMEFKGLDHDLKVVEQELAIAPPRNGFVAVEWGGIEIE